MEIGNIIKDARKKSSMTQEEAAEKLCISRQTISNWENGKTLPDIVSVIKMSDLYQISLDELLKGDTRMIKKVERDEKEKKFYRAMITSIIGLLFLLVISILETMNIPFLETMDIPFTTIEINSQYSKMISAVGNSAEIIMVVSYMVYILVRKYDRDLSQKAFMILSIIIDLCVILMGVMRVFSIFNRQENFVTRILFFVVGVLYLILSLVLLVVIIKDRNKLRARS